MLYDKTLKSHETLFAYSEPISKSSLALIIEFPVVLVPLRLFITNRRSYHVNFNIYDNFQLNRKQERNHKTNNDSP